MEQKKPDTWNYKRAPFKDEMAVSLMLPHSTDTCSTVKLENAFLAPEVERAAAMIRQNPDVTVNDVLNEFPEIKKRCGDRRVRMLIDCASDTEHRFSTWRFCVEVFSEVSRYPFDTIKKYLYSESRQKKQSAPGRPIQQK
jgi:hypothetical protein